MCVGFNVPINTFWKFGDESFQSVTCTSTDNLTRYYTDKPRDITQRNAKSGPSKQHKHTQKNLV